MNYPTKRETGQLNKHVVIAPSGRTCVGGYVWRERRLALHVCEGSRVASVPAQGNSKQPNAL